MSESEATAPTSAGQAAASTSGYQPVVSTSGHQPAADVPAEPAAQTAGAAASGGVHDLPWSPPPRGSRTETRRSQTEDSTGEPRTRSARRAAASRHASSGDGSVTELIEATSPVDGGATTDEPGARRPGDAEPRRPWVLWVVVGAAVVVVAAVVVTFVLLSGDDAKSPTATVTTTMAVPSPTTSPLDRADATALVQALPGTVRQFVLTSVTPLDGLAGALEAYTTTYEGEALDAAGNPVLPTTATSTDGSAAADDATSAGAEAPAFIVTVGQWRDAESASAGAASLSADLGTPTSTEDVTVGGETTGSISFFLPEGDASGTAVWTNGTVVLRAVGPRTEVVNFATAFGL